MQDIQTEKGSQIKENKYFQLMQVVGTDGKYQNIVLLMFSVLLFQVGCLSLGNPYYFAVAPYAHCPQPYTTASSCNTYVCSLPQSERNQYLEPSISQLRTLGNQFGDYHCEKSDIIATAMGMFFLGSIIGYLCMASLVDNFGRKLTFNICLLIGLVGQFSVLIAPKLVLAQIGLFLAGFGLQNAINLCFYFLSQQFEDKKRQIGGVIIQCCFCVGGLSTILWFYVIKNWKIIFWVCYFLPLCGITVLSFLFLKETPQFLIKRYEVQEIRQQLKFIAKINKRKEQFATSQYTSAQSLQSLKNQYNKLSQSIPFFTFRDLFRYKSLRNLSLLLGLVAFSVDFLYYAPLMLIEEFGFNFYVNGVIVNISEFVTYGITFFYITKIQRKKIALYLFSLAFVCSFALVFLHTNVICQKDCWNAKMSFELIFVFILRFAVALEFQILLIYVNELYPTQIAGIGVSYIALMGTLPNLFLPELINLCNRYGLNVMIFFCIISVVGLIPSKFIKETKGLALTEQIKEIGNKEEMVMTDRNKQIELVEQMS